MPEEMNNFTKAAIIEGLARNLIYSNVLAEKLELSTEELKEKLKHPEILNLWELRIIAKLCNMTSQQIINMLGMEKNNNCTGATAQIKRER